MKETVNVSIASQAFTLDQDAYNLLSGYLREVKARLGEGENDETYADIEARIAEIFREKRPSSMMVITIDIVRSAMAQMGTPDDFGCAGSTGAPGEDSATNSANRSEQKDYRYNRRNFEALRRSHADRMIAGVCGGLAEHFGIDAAMLRLITMLLVIFGGLSLWIYIILWIFLPLDTKQ
jgi:phage shock protein PspC (stress-responsive transcriptional regulator)